MYNGVDAFPGHGRKVRATEPLGSGCICFCVLSILMCLWDTGWNDITEERSSSDNANTTHTTSTETRLNPA